MGTFPVWTPVLLAGVSEGDALKVFPECSAELARCPEEQVP